MRNVCGNRSLRVLGAILSLYTFCGCGLLVRGLVTSNQMVPRSLATLTRLSTHASTINPEFEISGLSAGDRVILVRGADANCAGGNIVGQVKVEADDLEPTIRASQPGLAFARTDNFNALITRVDGTLECTDPATFEWDVLEVTDITVGQGHACGLLPTGSIKCWGWNDNGELGNSSTGTEAAPVDVDTITNATQIASSPYHTCARLSTGEVYCWGAGSSGQAGDGLSVDSSTPVQATGITTATQIATGHSHTCAVLASGVVNCWGYGGYGQLGHGFTTDSSTPIPVTGVVTATQVSAGEGHSCALLADSSVSCWGEGSAGQLGDNLAADSTTSVVVSGITDAIQISAGHSHTCALRSGGSIVCWG